MAKLKYIVRGTIMGIPTGSVIEVDEQAVIDQGLSTILELAPEGAEVTSFGEGADEAVDEPGPEIEPASKGAADPQTTEPKVDPAPPAPETKTVPGGPPKAAVQPVAGK